MDKRGDNKLTKSKIFLYACIAFILGIALASYLPERYLAGDLVWFIAAAVVFIAAFFSWPKRKFGNFFLFGLFFILGIWRYAVGIIPVTPANIAYYNNQAVTIAGIVTGEPDIRETNIKYTVAAKALASQPAVSGKILVTAGLYPRYRYGDELELSCNLEEPEAFDGFAYDRYLARYDVFSLCYYPKITLLSTGQGSRVYTAIFAMKDKFKAFINSGLSEPEASLARAMLLGDKRGLPDDLRTAFSKAGLSHIAAISGMHISILSALTLSLLLALGLSRKIAFYAAVVLLALFIILIGLPASAMRAGLMGFLVLLALNLGRLNRLANSIVLAGAVLLLLNPRLLRDDIGFQLSFLAVLGIAFLYPAIERLLERLVKFKNIRDIIAVTLAAQITTLPVIAYNFNQVSLIAPLANLLVLWTLPLIMIAVITALALSLLTAANAALWFFPGGLFLKYVENVSAYMTVLPYSYLSIQSLWWGWAVLYYLLLTGLILKLKRKTAPAG